MPIVTNQPKQIIYNEHVLDEDVVPSSILPPSVVPPSVVPSSVIPSFGNNKRKHIEINQVQELLEEKHELIKELNALKAERDQIQIRITTVGKKITVVDNNIALAKIEDAYSSKNLRVDNQIAKRQKREHLNEQLVRRTNSHDPQTCDQMQKSGKKCQKKTDKTIDGMNYCKSCLQSHALAAFTSKLG